MLMMYWAAEGGLFASVVHEQNNWSKLYVVCLLNFLYMYLVYLT